MAHLAQAYIHFRPYSASDEEIQVLGKFAQQIAKEAAADVYGGGVKVVIELEEGSLRARLTIVGAFLLGTHSHVADYKGFKESVVSMCEDAREFAVDVCAPFAEKAGVAPTEIYRFERRLKTLGKFLRIARSMAKLQNSVDSLSPKDVQKELALLRYELDLALRDLTSAEAKEVEKGLRSKKLPPPSKWPAPQPHKAAIHRDDSDEEMPLEDDKVPADKQPPSRRVVFRSTADVPIRKRREKKKPQTDIDDFIQEKS